MTWFARTGRLFCPDNHRVVTWLDLQNVCIENSCRVSDSVVGPKAITFCHRIEPNALFLSNFLAFLCTIAEINIIAIPCICQYFSLQWFAVVKVKNDGTWQGGLHRQFGEDVYRLLCEKLNSQPGDLIIFTAGKHTNAVMVSFSVYPPKFSQWYIYYVQEDVWLLLFPVWPWVTQIWLSIGIGVVLILFNEMWGQLGGQFRRP